MLEPFMTNINIQKSIIPEIVKHAPDAVYVMVSNPVDVLTYTFCRLSGIPEHKIIGSGTILDTARLRSRLAEYCDIDAGSINAYVFGEHGDSSFIPWSVANIAGVPVDMYENGLFDNKILTSKIDKAEIEKYVRSSGSRVIARKGATFYAVSSNVCHICKAILRGTNTAMTVSTLMHGEYGVDDVCLSTLAIVGKGGVVGKVNLPLNEEEVAALGKSADILKGIIKELDL